jgi:phosphoserine phosphatase
MSPLYRVSALLLAALATRGAFGEDALPSWNDGPAKAAITQFVARTTTEGSPDFVPVDERIAVFDNDGTLWCEQPIYVELAFALARVKALAPQHPEWKTTQPFQAVLEGDRAALAASGKKGLAEILATTHTGMTVDQFQATVKEWLATAKHPKYGRPYTECVYLPMQELLGYLRANGFKTFIVSGGTANFMRPFAETVYGIPPEQVVGTTFQTKYEFRDGKSAIVIEPAIDLVDDGAGKPVGIGERIGRRPTLAFGNSDGDFEMLEYVTSGEGPRLGLIVRHDDAVREYAYDRDSRIGMLSRALDAAPDRGWIVVGTKEDWKQIFPFATQALSR